MSTRPIGVQLYSVRDALSADFEGTLRRIAAMGYAGVEFAGNYGASLTETADLLKTLGLTAFSMHQMPPLDDAAFAAAAALGITRMVWPWYPPEKMSTVEGVTAACAEINAAAAAAAQHGIRFAYHNHDFEFRPLRDGKLVHEYMRELLDPAVEFEIDIYWVQFAGLNPVEVLQTLNQRTPLLHVKDGRMRPGDLMLAVGDGVVNVPASIQAASAAEWLIVELDACATDMFEALEKSILYLKAQGLGHGQ